MSRFVPHPFLSFVMLLTWVMLWQSLSPAALISGVVLALLLPRTLLLLGETPPKVHRPLVAVRLFFRVLKDIAHSNFAVVRVLLEGRDQTVPTGFVNIPLELENRYGLAILAAIITATPGTFWAAYNKRTNVLTIHVYDLKSQDEVRATIKGRYELPLVEIFQ